MPKQSKTDPLIKSMKQIYRKSAQSAWDTLLAEESRWKRKLTIAQNKLGEVRNRMNAFTQDLVKESDTGVACGKPVPVSGTSDAGDVRATS